jgi:hypothetical protein
MRQRPLPEAFGIHGSIHIGDEARRDPKCLPVRAQPPSRHREARAEPHLHLGGGRFDRGEIAPFEDDADAPG